MNQDKIKEIKQKYPKGTRIMLNSMDDPHHPVPSGTLGTPPFSSTFASWSSISF